MNELRTRPLRGTSPWPADRGGPSPGTSSLDRVEARLTIAHRELAAVQARELGLLDPHARGSWTHPGLTRMLYADGKVITPLFNGRFGTTRLDPVTGKRHQVRFEPDAGVHFEGGGSV